MLLTLSKSQVIYLSKMFLKKRKEKPSYRFQEQLPKYIYYKFCLDLVSRTRGKLEFKLQDLTEPFSF